MEFTKEDNNKLQQILKELKETHEILQKNLDKGGEGSGVEGHQTERNDRKKLRAIDPRLARIRTKERKRESSLQYPDKISNRERRVTYSQ